MGEEYTYTIIGLEQGGEFYAEVSLQRPECKNQLLALLNLPGAGSTPSVRRVVRNSARLYCARDFMKRLETTYERSLKQNGKK